MNDSHIFCDALTFEKSILELLMHQRKMNGGFLYD